MSSLRQDEPAHLEPSEVVAVQQAGDGAPVTAHAISASMARLGDHGVARCGFPVEYLTVVPVLTWTQVRDDHRCQHCAADLSRPTEASMPPPA